MPETKKILFMVTEDWFFYSHRLSLANACRDAGWKVSVTCRVTDHGEKIRAAGMILIPSRISRGKFSFSSVINDIRTILDWKIILRRERPDIVHLVGMKPVVFGWLAMRFNCKVPTVNALTGMGYIFTSAQLHIRLLRIPIRWILRKSLQRKNSWLVVQNQHDAKEILAAGLVDEDRLEIIMGSGVNPDRFVAHPEKPGRVVAAYVGRMLRDKGVFDLVKAARELGRRKKDIEIWLVGAPDSGNPTSIPEDLLRAWTEEGCIKWLGFRDDIEDVWKNVHIAILPSYREGMPLSLLEASAFGRPLVTTDVPGCNELVIHGLNGYVVRPSDWRNFANAIEVLADSPELRLEMGRKARERVESVFDENTVNRQMMLLYQKILSPPDLSDHG